MRGAPKSKLTPAQRRARRIAATRRWTERRAVANLARGLRTDGCERKRKTARLSPRMQRLLAQYQRQQQRARKEVQPTPLELAWRAERASMGEIVIPEPECSVLRGVKKNL